MKGREASEKRVEVLNVDLNGTEDGWKDGELHKGDTENTFYSCLQSNI